MPCWCKKHREDVSLRPFVLTRPSHVRPQLIIEENPCLFAYNKNRCSHGLCLRVAQLQYQVTLIEQSSSQAMCRHNNLLQSSMPVCILRPCQEYAEALGVQPGSESVLERATWPLIKLRVSEH